MSDSYPQLPISSRHEWRDWLHDNHHRSRGVWLVTWKKGHGPYVPYDELIDDAVAHGWIDSLPRSLDEDRTQRLLTPRKPGSSWSRVNKQRVQRLLAAGAMLPPGLAAVEAAKAAGTWERLDQVEDLAEPDDLRGALDASPAARAAWDGFPRSTKRAILEWIGTAKTDATRAKRIATTVSEAEQGRRANQWRQPRSATPR